MVFSIILLDDDLESWNFGVSDVRSGVHRDGHSEILDRVVYLQLYCIPSALPSGNLTELLFLESLGGAHSDNIWSSSTSES